MEQSSKKPCRPDYARTQSVRLPTPPPPPDPGKVEATAATKALTDKENEFLDYLNSLPLPGKYQPTEKVASQRTGSVFAPAMAAEDAFDHLDKLYKLMEQLLNLREQNAKLQRRVRDLEHFRNLQNLQHQVTTSVLSGEEKEVPELDDDSIFAEAILDDLFSKRTMKHKSPTQFKFRQSILRPQRDRSCSLAVDDVSKAGNVVEPEKGARECMPRNCSGKSLSECASLRKPSKVSKWTRVKAAFKWEKAASTVSGAKSQDSGIGGMLPVNNEVARYLRVPSTCDNRTESGTSPADSVLSGSWQGVHALSTPGTLSPASSTDDLNASTQSEQRSVSRTGSAGNSNTSGKRAAISRTSDEEDTDRRSHSLDYSSSLQCDSANSIAAKDEPVKLQPLKSHKTPWGKVKDIIQIRKDSLKKKQYRLSSRSDDCRTDWSAGSDQEDVFEPAQPVTTRTEAPTVTVTASDSTASHKQIATPSQSLANSDDCHKIPADVLARYQRAAAEEDKCQSKPNAESPRVQRRVSKWTRVKKAFLPSTSFNKTEDETVSQPASPLKHFQFFSDNHIANSKENEFQDKLYYHRRLKDDPETRELKAEIYRNYEQLQKKLSQEFQEKLQEWEKVKIMSCSPTSITFASAQSIAAACAVEENRNPEFARKMEEWEKIRQNNAESNKRRNIQMTSEENLPADFRKKLQEWQKIKKFGTKDEEVTTSSRKKKTEWQLWRSNSKQENNPPENRHYSEDFLKKLDEWKQIKSSHVANVEQDHQKVKENATTSPGLVRKSSSNKLLRQSKKHKMQEWLEKELQKIEREKQRLEREREKFLEREERLAKLRRSIGTGQHKKDVLVQTSTGFYRFEGISRKFTQRLYEWEKARGIGPEDSTFALLNSGYKKIFPHPTRIISGNSYRHEKMAGLKLSRSKSMDSVANLTCGESLITHQPSSLSLNDMEDLEMRCLAESASDQILNESEDNLDYPEPEAVIVEVEDFVEETAAPLEYLGQNQHTPVYHTEVLNLCESEKCEAPKVRRSESARALSNYNLIHESLDILNKIRANEDASKTTEIKLTEAVNVNREKERQLDTCRSMGAIPKRKRSISQSEQQNILLLQDSLGKYYIQQTEISQGLIAKILLLQDANTNITKNACSENSGFTISHFTDTLNIVQDVSSELISVAEKLKQTFTERQAAFYSSHNKLQDNSKMYGQTINELVTTLILKIKELKRCLSYLCAATDMTAPGRRKKGSYKDRRHSLHKRASLEKTPTASNEKIAQNDNTSDEEDYTTDKVKAMRKRDKLVKSKSEDNHLINHTHVQITSTPSLICNSGSECILNQNDRKLQIQKKPGDSDFPVDKLDFDTEIFQNQRMQKKLLRSRRISETCSDSNKEEQDISESDEKQSQPQRCNLEYQPSSITIPPNIQYLEVTSDNGDAINMGSPVSVFVQTTRKIFIPFLSDALDTKTDNTPENNFKHITEQKQENPVKNSQNMSTDNTDPIGNINDDKLNNNLQASKNEENLDQIDENAFDNQTNRPTTPSHLPPLPNSPVTQRRDRHLIKETSPAIRMMIARYNQKLFEQESLGPKSGGSSGSASPVAWRSPVLERRVKAQTEKYEEEVNKSIMNHRYSPLFSRKLVQKSASVGVMHSIKKQFTVPEVTERDESLDSTEKNTSPRLIRGILKSTSMDCMKSNQMQSMDKKKESLKQNLLAGNSSKLTGKASQLKLSIPPPRQSFETSPVLRERAYKLQKAKEEFLQQHLETPTATSTASATIEPLSAPIVTNKTQTAAMNYPTRNRLSQVSVGSESSCDEMKQSLVLVRSVSAGMINVDEVTYQQFRPEIHSQGYVSLPRSTKKKDGKFGISSLASKFRRVKMRRCKDPCQMNTISTLCRQSLVVDITDNEENEAKNVQCTVNQERSLDTQQASTSKSSWIKNPSRIFKPK